MIDTAVKQLRKIQGNDGKFPRKSSATYSYLWELYQPMKTNAHNLK